MPFPPKIREEALVKSKRYCCVCHNFSGRDVNVHHIKPEASGGPNTIDNAIVLCLRCHSEAGHYNSQHPLGTKYSPSELRQHRDKWWELITSGKVDAPNIDVKVAWKRVYTSQDLHTYKLVICINNGTQEAINSWKLQLFFPAVVSVRANGVESVGVQGIENCRYQVFELKDGQIMAGENIEVISQFSEMTIEYDMNDRIFRMDGRHMLKFYWCLFMASGRPINGEEPWENMHAY